MVLVFDSLSLYISDHLLAIKLNETYLKYGICKEFGRTYKKISSTLPYYLMIEHIFAQLWYTQSPPIQVDNSVN